MTVKILPFDRSVMTFSDGNKKISLVSLAIPLFLQRIFDTLCSTINILLLTGYSETAVSASSVANQIVSMNTTILLMITTGMVVLTSIELGAKNPREAGAFTGTGAIASVILGIFLAAVNFIFAEPFMIAMNLSGTTLEMACQYLKMRALFLPISGLLVFFNHALICNGFSKYTFITGALTNVFNLLFSYIALYSGMQFMTPISRVGIAFGLAQLCGLLFAVKMFKRTGCPWSFGFSGRKAGKIFKIGVPGTMALIVFCIAQTVTTGFVAAMGDDVINTKAYINNIVAYVPLAGYALANANQVFLGRFRGAGELEKSNVSHKQNCLLAVSFNILLSAAALILHRPLLMMFTTNPNIINAAGTIFFIDLFVQIFRAVNNVSEGSLCANGDTRITLVASTISCLLGSLALAYLLCVVLGWGLVGLWIAFAADEATKAIIYLFRWRSGKWRTIKI